MNKSNASLLYSTLAIAAILGFFFSPFVSIASAQSPMDLMSMMNSNSDDNETENGMISMRDMMMTMEDGGDNMSMSMMPFKMGVMVTPMMCTSPNELLGTLSGMLGGSENATENRNGDDNATGQMAMEMMQQKMMTAGGGGLNNGMENMSEAHLQEMMNMAICFPMMGGEMMNGMQGMNGMDKMMSMGQ